MHEVQLNYKEIFKSWESPLRDNLLNTKYMAKLINITQSNYKTQKIFPAKKNIFRAFKLTPFDKVKVVIVGQDPYPNVRATGLAFANEEGHAQFALSPSLQVMADCIERDFYEGLNLNFDPTLVSWGQQGVLLLNSALTVEEGHIGGHASRWHKFIRETIAAISREKTGACFLFLGAQAKMFARSVNVSAHYVFNYHHPSFSARLGRDWKCPYFKEINKVLEAQNGKDNCIKW